LRLSTYPGQKTYASDYAMNIETTKTVEDYEYNKRWLERRRAKTCREKRDAVTAELRERGQPLFQIAIILDNVIWHCHADRDAIRTFKEDGYTIRMPAAKFREIPKARPGSNQQTINFTDSNCLPDEKVGDSLEPWMIASFFEYCPRFREAYHD
jgi:hypothetical protein